MRASVLLGLSLYLAVTTSPAFCQDDDSAGGVRTQIQGIEIPAIANAPFTAKILVTWNRPLVGGGTASRKYYTQVARDSQGRVRRETRGFIPADSGAEPPLRSFTVLDPVTSTRTTCTTTTMNCAKSSFEPQLDVASDGAMSGGGSNAARENLGQQTMNGLSVVGTRETETDSQGSSRVAISRTDTWYSPDLHMDLSIARSNPQLGEVALQVTELVRGEPNSSWFAIPSGYRVIGGRNP